MIGYSLKSSELAFGEDVRLCISVDEWRHGRERRGMQQRRVAIPLHATETNCIRAQGDIALIVAHFIVENVSPMREVSPGSWEVHFRVPGREKQ